MNLIKRLISCAVAFACVSVPMNSIISVDNNINAVEEITESPIWDGTADISWYDDDETEFHLSTAEELAGLSELSRVGKTMEGKTIYLDNDVILNDTSDFENWTKNLKLLNNWTSISNFKGTFEGQGHNISGIYCESFFTYISDGKINSVNFTESYVYKSINTNTLHDYKYYTDYNYCGGICNKIFNTTISNCTYSGFVHSSFDSRGVVYCYVGGICGYAYDSEILNCANYSEVYHYEWLNYGYAEYAKRIYTGGLCGSISNCTISNCTNKGNVGMQLHEKDNAKGWVGGICGLSESSSINNCYNTSAIGSASNNLLIGGICAGGKISNSYNIGNLIGGSEGCSINGIGGKSENSFYLSGVALKDNGEAKAKSKTNMQMPEFAKTLGDAFVYVEGDYPKLAWELGILMTGDINNDGKIDISDAVLLQKYLLGVQQFTKEQGEAADIYQDGFIDAFDMVLMRQLLISQL